MAQIEKVLSDSEASSSSTDEKISKVSYYLFESESESEYETSEYYDNSTSYGLFVNNDDDQEIFHDAIDSASENFIENHIDSQKDYDKSDVDHNDSEEKDHLLIRDVNDAMGSNKKTVVVTSDPLALIAEKTNVSRSKDKVVVSSDSKGSEADDFNNKQQLETSSSSQSANKKQEFVKSYDKKVEKKANEKKRDMSRVKCYNYKKEGHFAKDCKKAKVKDYEYYKTKMLLTKKDKDEQVLLAEDQAWIESSSDSDQEINVNMEKYAKLEAERYEYMIRYSAYFDNDKQYRKQIADQQVLFDKMSVQMVELDKHVRDLKNTIKGIGFENPNYFEKAKDLRPTLYDEKVIGLGYTPMFLTHSDEALEIEKFKRSRENKIEFAYDYGNLNASYVNENIKFEDDYFQEIIYADFEKIDSPFQQTNTFSSVRRPKNSGVIWKKKKSSNTFNVGWSAVSVSNLNKNVKRYS
nr:hypothetical protein [Tanacetum cinerariifolium]